eukprot:868194-Amphidinium_carterae.1
MPLAANIAAFARSAWLYTQVEQLIDPQIAEGILPDEPQTSAPANGRRPVQRADIHIADLTGADIFLDVRVTHVPRDCLPQQHLQLTASRKAAEYACTGVTPVIFSTDTLVIFWTDGGYDAAAVAASLGHLRCRKQQSSKLELDIKPMRSPLPSVQPRLQRPAYLQQRFSSPSRPERAPAMISS